MTLHKITEFYTERFSACRNMTSKFHAIAIFKSFVKQNNDLHKICRHIHDVLLFRLHLSCTRSTLMMLHQVHSYAATRL
jgi:hypothetical protein